MVGVEVCQDLVVEEGYQDTQVVVVVVVEVPSQVRVEGVAVLACQGGVELVEVLACLVKEVGEEYLPDLVKEEGVGEQVCLHDLVRVGVEVEGAHRHFGLGEEGHVVVGANQ